MKLMMCAHVRGVMMMMMIMMIIMMIVMTMIKNRAFSRVFVQYLNGRASV